MVSDELAQIILDAALRGGAEYAEVRIESGRVERAHVRNAAVEQLSAEANSGWGVHVLAGEGWGFTAASTDDPIGIEHIAKVAVDIARASAEYSHSKSDLSLMSREVGTYSSQVERDAFPIPTAERADLLVEASMRMGQASPRVRVANATFWCSNVDKLYVNSVGAHLRQDITHTGAWMSALATDDTGYSYRRSYGDMSQAGWEFVENLNLL